MKTANEEGTNASAVFRLPIEIRTLRVACEPYWHALQSHVRVRPWSDRHTGTRRKFVKQVGLDALEQSVTRVWRTS
jgi:hypothetical protein